MLFAALSKTGAGITIHYQYGGHFVEPTKHLKVRTKVFEVLARDLLFADNCALAAYSETHLQDLPNCLAEAA